MKKLFTIFAIFLSAISALGQTNGNNDVIQKTDGQEMKGKVVRITDADVTFIYTGESAEYIIKKSDIAKIVHSSGRTETFGQTSQHAEARSKESVDLSPSSADHHNKIAVLPFIFLMENQTGSDEIGLKAQDETFDFLSKNSPGYTVLDNRTVNALLGKAGVTKDKVMNFTMKEIGNILGAEYLITGTVTQNKAYQSNYGSGRSEVKVDDKKVSASDSNYSTTEQQYDVSVSLHVYMDNNASIYNQTHQAFFSNRDGSFSNPLQYLLKRSPLYIKQ